MLSAKTLMGAGWSASSRAASRVIDLLTLLVMARLLGPADFGLTAIAVSLISIVDMVLEVPLVQALTRLRTLGKDHLDTAFTIGLLRGLAIAAVLVAAAWPISIVYGDPRLFWLISVLALGPISRSLNSPAMVVFFRDIDFRTSFIIDLSGKLLASLLSIVLLMAGAGYWALVVNTVASSVIPMVLSYVVAPYRPALSLTRLSDFSAFTGWFTASQIMAALNWQYDRIFLGYHLDKANLGRYTVASDFSVLPTQSLVGPAMKPVMAAFASIADNRERLRAAFLKASRVTMLIAAPAGLGIALTSDLIVTIVLGPQWVAASGYLTWLALAVVPTAYNQAFSSMAVAMDRPSLLFKTNVIDLILRTTITTMGYYLDGLSGMLHARIVASLLLAAIGAFYVRQLIGLSAAAQARNLWQVVLSCLIMASCVLILRQELPYINLGVVGALIATALTGSLIYVGSMFALGFRLRALV